MKSVIKPKNINYDVYQSALLAADEIGTLLDDTIKINTGLKFKFFSGVSVLDFANIIEKHFEG